MNKKIDVAIAIKTKDYEELMKSVWQNYRKKEISKAILNFFWQAKLTRKTKYVLLKWVAVKWDDTNEETEYLLDCLEKIKHYDLIRIDGSEIYMDLHTGKDILKVEYDVVLNA